MESAWLKSYLQRKIEQVIQSVNKKTVKIIGSLFHGSENGRRKPMKAKTSYKEESEKNNNKSAMVRKRGGPDRKSRISFKGILTANCTVPFCNTH